MTGLNGKLRRAHSIPEIPTSMSPANTMISASAFGGLRPTRYASVRYRRRIQRTKNGLGVGRGTVGEDHAMQTLVPADFATDLDLTSEPSRRVFIKGLGFVSVALVTGSLGGCEKLAEAIRNRPVRRRLRTGSQEVDASIDLYKQAVVAMKALPASDPRSWTAQAQIHGTVTGGFNFCEHGTDHFFDWHRAYLLYFERICQQLTGNKKFGLPYWNWNQNPDIHPDFLDPNSVLFLARTRTSMTGSSSITTAELDPILADTNFFTFRPQIEGTPHNTVHGYIGGTMGTGGSALDPVFWTHHCMVDYCWAKW